MSEPGLIEVLGPGGRLAEASEGYEDRPQQRRMADAVARALARGHHLTVEAGTGTGKTLAYLLPAVLSGRRIVVSTATKALQDQVFEKDLPLLAEVLGRPISAARLKGRGNYVCLTRKARFDAQPTFERREEGATYDAIDAWVKTTESGDKAELHAVPETHSAWSQICSTSDSCTGQKCEAWELCFVTREREKAAQAQVVVVNHHLFFADLSLKSSSAGQLGGAEVIPPYEAVIFDEAHALEDVATTFFGVSFSSRQCTDLARDAGRVAAAQPELASALGEAAARLERRAKAFFACLPGEEGRGALEPRTVEDCLEERDALREALKLLAAVASEAREDEEVQSLGRRAREGESALFLVTTLDDPTLVYWMDRRARSTVLQASPIDVAPVLQEILLRQVDVCTFTSATLATNGGLGFFQNRIGLVEEGEERFEQESLILDSPFDYERQAALYVPTGLPEPNRPGFVEAVAEEALQLIELTGGRAFVLCTSRRNMFAIHDLIAGRFDAPLYLQGQAPKQALLERFQEAPSVLVATQSFWEGVDVPGDALSLVIIDKLPFASPGDPIVAARMRALEEAGKSAFGHYQLPQAALALKQGFGRLIRTRRDRGIVAICDERLATRRYRGHFLRTLPPAPRFRDRDALALWWAEAREQLDSRAGASPVG
ncbi:MAG: ATP-dependent DNA helicase [Deltaproteobacteria bacterium]|nr:ATP-dependent DNA helicase [Deltaproteobacteria bacterium]